MRWPSLLMLSVVVFAVAAGCDESSPDDEADAFSAEVARAHAPLTEDLNGNGLLDGEEDAGERGSPGLAPQSSSCGPKRGLAAGNCHGSETEVVRLR